MTKKSITTKENNLAFEWDYDDDFPLTISDEDLECSIYLKREECVLLVEFLTARLEDGDQGFFKQKGFIMEERNFGWAISELNACKHVARRGWNGPGQYLGLQVPDEGSKMTLPYIYIRTVQGDLVPWLASQTDMLADDWVPVD